jgi:pseudouridine synthase
MSADGPKGIRLQKFIADAGVTSRRKAEELMLAGRVKVNGEVARELGIRVVPGRDRVEVDGKRVEPEESRWVMLYKPQGCITTRKDTHGRPTVYDHLPSDLQGLRYVGRLDQDTEGLLLFTNDGDAMERLLHPRYGVEREYLAWVDREPDGEQYRRLREGVELEDGLARVTDVRLSSRRQGRWILALVMQEGRKREVRRLLEAVGLPVLRLKRVRFGSLRLRGLKPGEWRELTADESRAVTGGNPRRGRGRGRR